MCTTDEPTVGNENESKIISNFDDSPIFDGFVKF